MSKKTIFMDIDGVLHPSDYLKFEVENNELIFSGNLMFCWADIICEITKKSECDIVIHSSWRNNYSFEQLKSLLPRCISDKVVAVTFGTERYESIISYAHANCLKRYIILDDSQDEFPLGCKELILCDSTKGISEADVQYAIKKFIEQA